MASLLALTQQGDVGTVADASKLSSSFKLMDPQQLYELWEKQNWISGEIEFARDVEDWASLSEQERHDITWTLSSFFIGEERVTTQFSGLVMSYEDQHEEAFLTTQQVDEARHAQHFNNLWEQVLQHDGTFEQRLDDCRATLNEDYFRLFDGMLVDANRALIEHPRDVEAKVDFIVIYHMVIEGTLALTGQYFQTGWMERQGILPGHHFGFQKISQDEHRHVAYGTWYLQRQARDPALAQRIQDRLMATLPAAAGVLVPPGHTLGEDYVYLGQSSQDMNEFAFTALSRRLKVIGVGLPAVAA